MHGNTLPADTLEKQTNCKPGSFYVFDSMVLINNNI